MPPHATPRLKDLAQRLLLCETAPGKPTGTDAAAAFRVCEKLRRPLVRLMGVAGFRALLCQILGLLVTFIGPALTVSLLQDAWPKEDFSEFESSM